MAQNALHNCIRELLNVSAELRGILFNSPHYEALEEQIFGMDSSLVEVAKKLRLIRDEALEQDDPVCL